MRVLWGEIRKLLWWRNLLIAFLLGAIYYWVIVWSLVGLFPNGHPMTEHHHYTQAWHDEFGPTLEPSEVAVIEARLAALVREADAVIAADPPWRPTASRAGGPTPNARNSTRRPTPSWRNCCSSPAASAG